MSRAPMSAVIPTFNSGHMVTAAIESVLAQTVVPEQVIVVDDGSTDDTRDRLSAYGDRIEYRRQDNAGVSAARNRGIEQARTEFVAFLDADDVWHPRKCELQLRAFERRPDLGLVGTGRFDWPGEIRPLAPEPDNPVMTPVSWSDLVIRNYLTTSSVMVRTDVLRRAGPFDCTLQGPEDRDVWLRVAEIASVTRLELPLTGYRDVPGSVSKQATRCQSSMLRILRKLDDRGAWHGRWALRRKAYAYVYHSCCYLHGAAGDQRCALANAIKSFFWYPVPFRRREVGRWGERPRRSANTFLRWLGLKRVPGPA